MQIVIEIDKETYIDIKKGKIYSSIRDVPQESVKAIANGTVLPEHGRLGDLDEIIKTIDREYPNLDRQDIKQWIENADTILEAWGNEE